MGTLIDEINMLALSASLNTCCEIRLCTIPRLFSCRAASSGTFGHR
jgi:hypothetical protein